MRPTAAVFLILALVTGLAACGGGATGGLGSVPSAAPTASPQASGPDETPAPSSSVLPSTGPSQEPGASPSPSVTPSGSPGATMIVRAYFVLGGGPGVTGLVPVLRTVPQTTGVAKAAM